MKDLTTILTATNSSTPNNTTKSAAATQSVPPTTIKFGEQLAQQLQWSPATRAQLQTHLQPQLQSQLQLQLQSQLTSQLQSQLTSKFQLQLQRSSQPDLPQPVAPPKAAATPTPTFTVRSPASSIAGSNASLVQASQLTQRPKSNVQTTNASTTKGPPNSSPASAASLAQNSSAQNNGAAGTTSASHVSAKDSESDSGTSAHDDSNGEAADPKMQDDQPALDQTTSNGDQAQASALMQATQRPLSLAELLVKSAADQQSASELLVTNVQAARQSGVQAAALESTAMNGSVATIQSLRPVNDATRSAGLTTDGLAVSTIGPQGRVLELANTTALNAKLGDQKPLQSSSELIGADGQQLAGDAVLATMQMTATTQTAALVSFHASANVDLVKQTLSALMVGNNNSTVGASANSASLAQATLSPLAPDFSERFAIKVGEFAVAGADRAEIRLSPAELGPIHLRISMVGSDASITLSAQHPDTFQAIERSVTMLRQMLAEQGVRIDSLNLNSGTSNGWSASANAWGGAGNTGSQAQRSTASASDGDDSASTDIAAVSGSTRASALSGRHLIDVFV